MSNLLSVDLEELAPPENHSALVNYVRLYQIEILERWTNATHDDLEKFLRLSEQKVSRAKRFFDQRDGACQNAFFLGMIQGFVTAFRELLREEKKDRQIIGMCASQTEKTDRILLALASENGGQGMRHGELAEAVAIPYSSLTNIMKRILQSRAVTATRSGKNTYYTLTKAGRRYCEKKREYPNAATWQDMANYLRKMASELESKYVKEQERGREQGRERGREQGRERGREQGREQGRGFSLALFAGDTVKVTNRDKTMEQLLRIQLITETAKGKRAICEEIDESSALIRPGVPYEIAKKFRPDQIGDAAS